MLHAAVRPEVGVAARVEIAGARTLAHRRGWPGTPRRRTQPGALGVAVGVRLGRRRDALLEDRISPRTRRARFRGGRAGRCLVGGHAAGADASIRLTTSSQRSRSATSTKPAARTFATVSRSMLAPFMRTTSGLS